jgi:hypothetical protein
MNKALYKSLKFSIWVNGIGWMSGFVGALLEDLIGPKFIVHVLHFLYIGPLWAGVALIAILKSLGIGTGPARPGLATALFDLLTLLFFVLVNLAVWFAVGFVYFRVIAGRRRARDF